MAEAPLVEAAGLAVRYGVGADAVTAVAGVDLAIARGEVLGLVGESGCGKSTLGRAILRLVPVHGGRVRFDGTDITDLPERALRPLRPRMQIVFQDPFAALNPRKTVGQAVGDPLHAVLGLDRTMAEMKVAALLARVGLLPEHAERLPHEFSGGQRQRIGIARALALDPDFIVCDEPVSALDVSVRAQVLNLLADIRAERGLAMLFISHDLSVVEHIADRVAVMYLGRIVESGPARDLFAGPRHPYTRALVASVPRIGATDDTAVPIEGDPPSPRSVPAGCRFRSRCPRALPCCAAAEPPLAVDGAGRLLACFNP
ncbi:MAG: ABC transporter ATP-binding protein [Alphaproteobacteria bacterium]|nr:ABC transporter ATP-binding protein [Alphaproteobacteria bacterium]